MMLDALLYQPDFLRALLRMTFGKKEEIPAWTETPGERTEKISPAAAEDGSARKSHLKLVKK